MSRSNPATTHSNAGIAAWKFKLRAEIHSWGDCVHFTSEHGNGARLGPQMTVEVRGKWCAVTLYRTEIIRYYPDGSFSVDNGGFATPTTRERLQAVVPRGFLVSHHRRQLGLWRTSGPHGGERGPLDRCGLWPLDHSKRVTTDGEIVA